MYIDLNHTTVLMGNHVVQGWAAESDACSLPDLETFAIDTGATGRAQFIRNGTNGGEVMFKLQATSPSTAFFMKQHQIALEGGTPTIWEGSVRDDLNNTTTRLEHGVLKQAPSGPTLGDGEVGTFEFVFHFQDVIPEYDDALFA